MDLFTPPLSLSSITYAGWLFPFGDAPVWLLTPLQGEVTLCAFVPSPDHDSCDLCGAADVPLWWESVGELHSCAPCLSVQGDDMGWWRPADLTGVRPALTSA